MVCGGVWLWVLISWSMPEHVTRKGLGSPFSKEGASSGLRNRVDFPAVGGYQAPLCGLSWRLYWEPQQILESSITWTLGFPLSRAARSKRVLL